MTRCLLPSPPVACPLRPAPVSLYFSCRAFTGFFPGHSYIKRLNVEVRLASTDGHFGLTSNVVTLV